MESSVDNSQRCNWDSSAKKFARFVDKIDPYNKVHWQRNVLEFSQTCVFPTVKKYEEDSAEMILLKDIDDKAKRFELLSKKLKMCHIIFDFSNDVESKKRELKKRILSEILEYLIHGKEVLTPKIYPDIIAMVKKNIFRKLPEAAGKIDFDDDHYAREPSWPHIMLVYEIFLQFLKLPEFKTSPARPYINEEFVDQILYLFHGQDPHERRLLREVLLEIYKKFVVLRSHIRKAFYDFCWRYTFESKYIVGLPNLLGFYSSVISGFLKPLRVEHVLFFKDVFLKLHSCFMYPAYFTQLVDCLYEFLLKDPTLYEELIKALLMYWPKTSSRKQILFLNEMNDLMTDISSAEFITIMVPLFKQLSAILTSSNYFITEAVMDLLSNRHICCLIYEHSSFLMPIILPSLVKAAYNTNNPEKDRINMIAKGYRLELQDTSITSINVEIQEAMNESYRRELWQKVDAIEQGLEPLLRPLAVARKVEIEKDFEIISTLNEGLFSIFPEETSFAAADFSIPDVQEMQTLDAHESHEVTGEVMEEDLERKSSITSETSRLRTSNISSMTSFGGSIQSNSMFFESGFLGKRWQNVMEMSRIISQWKEENTSKSEEQD